MPTSRWVNYLVAAGLCWLLSIYVFVTGDPTHVLLLERGGQLQPEGAAGKFFLIGAGLLALGLWHRYVPPSARTPGMPRRLWFTAPVAINAITQLLFQFGFVVYDFGVMQRVVLYFSLPYWALVLLIARRRNRPGSIPDFLFLTLGQLACIRLLWALNGPR